MMDTLSRDVTSVMYKIAMSILLMYVFPFTVAFVMDDYVDTKDLRMQSSVVFFYRFDLETILFRLRSASLFPVGI